MIITLLFLLIGLGVIALALFLANRAVTNESVGGLVGSVLVGILGVLVLVFGIGWRQIEAGTVGVVTGTNGVTEQTLDPGLRWVFPFLNSVDIYDGRVQSYDFAGIEAFTLEQQPAHLTGQVQYHIDPATASQVHQTYGSEYATRVLKQPADEILKALARDYKTDAITAQRLDLGDKAQAQLQAAVGPLIVIDNVVVRDIALSDQYRKAIEDNQQAVIDKQRAQTLKETREIQADADAEVLRRTAQGQADANRLVNASLTSELIQWQQVQKLTDKISVMILPSGANPLFTIPTPTPAP